jgi:hypothetical protein
MPQQLTETSIRFFGSDPHFVIMAGGGGSGKGFVRSNLLDASTPFKVFDIDSLKSMFIELSKAGKLSISSILDKYGHTIGASDRINIMKRTLDVGKEIHDLDLKDPDDVDILHLITKITDTNNIAVKLHLDTAKASNRLQNILHDVTLRNYSTFHKLYNQAIAAGYKPANIHLIWVLSDVNIALERNNNPERGRVVNPSVILDAHRDVVNVMWDVIHNVPSGFDGKIVVVLNNPEYTVWYNTGSSAAKPTKGVFTTKPNKSSSGVVKDFVYLTIKSERRPVYPDSVWKYILVTWIYKNAPLSPSHKSIFADMLSDLRKSVDTSNPRVKSIISKTIDEN